MLTVADQAALAEESCAYCQGSGAVILYGNRRTQRRCDCVYRRVCRDSMRRFYKLHELNGDYARRPNYDPRCGAGFRAGEYMADVTLAAERTLAERPADLIIWRRYMLGGDSWELCARLAGLDRVRFYRRVYVIERDLGRAFLTLEPYGLYPRDYFAGHLIPEFGRRSATHRALNVVARGE